MMHYLDTNILIYAAVNQIPEKRLRSQSILQSLIEENLLLVSPLSLQELIFTLSKLKVPKLTIEDSCSFYRKLCRYEIDCEILESASKMALEIDFGRNINDVIHLKFAERYCEKLLTYDRDFKRLAPYSKIPVDIIN
ncbi:MAG: type II toxin-antitoxin system VapC family toxin [Desulfamplus sp.]|nr:type II toxin-antitoxin system VapC family toxin [Desulfamplus sp.]